MVLRTLKKINKKFFNRKKKKLRQNIIIKKLGNNYHISGSLSNKNFVVKQLWFVSRNNDHQIKVNSHKYSHEFVFNIDLSTEKELLKVEEDIYDLYLFIRVPEENISKKRAMSLNETNKYISKNGKTFY